MFYHSNLNTYITKPTNTHSEYVLLLVFYINNGYKDRPHCNIMLCIYCLSYCPNNLRLPNTFYLILMIYRILAERL